jgi:hypothetical protein
MPQGGHHLGYGVIGVPPVRFLLRNPNNAHHPPLAAGLLSVPLGHWIFLVGYWIFSLFLFPLDIGYSPAGRDPAKAGRILDP